MSKAGDEYQEIVGLVREALDPDAIVKVGQWIEGPDGRRDMDVEVRGTIEGKEQFILVECKDWKKKVGIETVDALESKRHDLAADHAVIYSNSGYSQPALRKARRVGIRLFSALKANDNRIKTSFYRQVVASSISVETYKIKIFYPKDEVLNLPKDWNARDVYYKDCPFVNFLQNESLEMIKFIDTDQNIILSYEFIDPEKFKVKEQIINLLGIEIFMKCKKKYVSQEVEENVTLGHYDFFNDNMAIPDKEAYIFGNFDQEKWEEVDLEKFEVRKKELQPNSFSLNLHLYKPIMGVEDECMPEINNIIKEKAAICEIQKC